LKTLEHTFLPPEPQGEVADRPPEERDQWRRRYIKAAAGLCEAGIDTVAEQEGVNAYIEQRACWNGRVEHLARYLGWRLATIDKAAPNITDG